MVSKATTRAPVEIEVRIQNLIELRARIDGRDEIDLVEAAAMLSLLEGIGAELSEGALASTLHWALEFACDEDPNWMAKRWGSLFVGPKEALNPTESMPRWPGKDDGVFVPFEYEVPVATLLQEPTWYGDQGWEHVSVENTLLAAALLELVTKWAAWVPVDMLENAITKGYVTRYDEGAVLAFGREFLEPLREYYEETRVEFEKRRAECEEDEAA